MPLLTVLGWVSFGPRRCMNREVVGLGLIDPLAWPCYTLGVAALPGWYPYPVLVVNESRLAAGTVAALGIAVFLLALSALVWGLHRVLGPAPVVREEVRR